MCCKVYEFTRKSDNSSLYLNGSDSPKCNPELILSKYIEWYNKDFAPFENLPQQSMNDFEFICSFCPIDFYDETCEMVNGI